MASSAKEACDARAVWERMIEAKGGRERLQSVQAMFVLRTYTWRQALVRHRLENRTLYRFPDFLWSWFDSGTQTLGITVSQSNLALGHSLSVLGPSVNPKLKRELLAPGVLPFREIPVLLLETRWMKPSLFGCSIDGWTTTLEASFDGIPFPYRYYLQGKAELPHRVEMPEGRGVRMYLLRDYKQTDGLMLPVTFRSEYGSLPSPTYTVRYEINPDYDPKLLDREPSLEAGPDAWRNPAVRKDTWRR